VSENGFQSIVERFEGKIDALFEKLDETNIRSIRNETRLGGLTGIIIAMPVIVTIALSVIFFIFK